MGEFSKKVGDIGENVVNDFLQLIGWQNLQQNIEISSINTEKHGRRTHGIDRLYHYINPMIARTMNSVLISSKYSSVTYPNNVSKTFKEYYYDLAYTIESFKKSELRENILNQYKGIHECFDKGILFWINNVEENNESLFYKLSNINLSDPVSHDGIFLIDNAQMGFIYDAIKDYSTRFLQSVPEFIYHQTGMNNDDSNLRTGRIMPVEMITTGVMPMKAMNAGGEITLSIYVKDNFEEKNFQKLIGLAKNLSNNLCNRTAICFPNYNRLHHETIAHNVIQGINDPIFTNNLSVVNYKSQLRG